MPMSLASAGSSMTEPFIGASAENASMRLPAASKVNEARTPLNEPVSTAPRSRATTRKSGEPSPLVSMAMSNSAAAAFDHWCQPLMAKTRH